ncbi:MAG: TrkH family potassium uptake protein [Anaerolineae bacterium]
MRYAAYLRQRYRAILGYTGLLCFVAGLLILAPLALLPVYPTEASLAWMFLLPGLLLVLPGLLLWRRLTPEGDTSLDTQEGAVIVVLAWLLAILAGAIPFLAAGGLDLTRALFESTSAWATAGLSVLDPGRASPLLLFYRSLLQLAGGAGLAIIMLSALAGPVGPGLSVAEGRSEQLLPHVRRSAALVLGMYSAYVLFGILALAAAGMSWFDAVNHAFAAVSTGGFSTRPESVAYWDSPAVEGVLVVLMLLGTTNFLTAYTLLRGRVRAALRSSEVRQTALLLVLGGGILLAGVTAGRYGGPGPGLRAVVFNTVSALSTTGFATVDYAQWNSLGRLVLVLLMLVGGATGSTAGGIKQYRVHVLYRGLVWEFRRRLLPPSAITQPDVWRGEGREFVDDAHLRQVAVYVFLYAVVLLAGSTILAACGYSFQDSIFDFTSALSTVGVSVGVFTASAPGGVLWTGIVAMFLGRLEFFAIILGLIRLARDLPVLADSAWRARRPQQEGE